MILSRAIRHLKQQHWTGVLIELVIVVLGVFIGLQAQDWASARAEQQRADVLLQQLRGDLASEKAGLQASRDYLEVVADYTRVGIDGLQAPDSIDPGTWVVSAYQASQIFDPSSNRSTYDEMKSTGAIDLIRDARLRAQLMAYYDYPWSDSPIARAQAPYRALVRSVLPYPVQQAIKASCGDRFGPEGGLFIMRLPKTCHVNLAPAQIAHAAEILRQTSDLQPALNYQLSITESKIEQIKQQQQQLAAVIAAARKDP
ncbi:MAG: hypothetical protein WBV39_10565 [Rudaea sp.]